MDFRKVMCFRERVSANVGGRMCFWFAFSGIAKPTGIKSSNEMQKEGEKKTKTALALFFPA